jgi:hypothetical protein
MATKSYTVRLRKLLLRLGIRSLEGYRSLEMDGLDTVY